MMSLVADYGSSDDESIDTASAEEGDRNDGSTARSIVYCLHALTL